MTRTKGANVPTPTEREIQSAIVRMAKQLGYLVYHTQYSLGSAPGFPDLVIAGHGCVWFLEIKGPRGKVSEQQEAWISELCEAEIPARVVWPEDLDAVLDELMTRYQEAA